ncbi:MAG: endopeptidase La [Proteobacteria bacterium]|nr:endopeptidase La [Pseudomonadota bacterium]
MPNTRVLPLLPLRDMVVFPYMVVPLFVGRDKSIRSLEESINKRLDVVLVAQKDSQVNNPTPGDIFEMGTVGNVIQLLRLPDGTVKVLIEGIKRVKINKFLPSEDHFLVEAEEVEDIDDTDQSQMEALVRAVKGQFERYVRLNKKIPPEMLMTISGINDASRLSDTISAHLTLKLEDKQKLLGILSIPKRLEELLALMQAEMEILQLEKRIKGRVKQQMEKNQKEYYLNEQINAIQKELGAEEEQDEITELAGKIRDKKMTAEARERAEKELKKLKMMSPMSAESAVVRNYIDWILSLPWEEGSTDNNDIEEAKRILDEDHYGLVKVKDRVIDYLAIKTLAGDLRGPILCLVGPPGVGKTSLAKSVARAVNRKFVRMSLGGVRDEAEIRGHRRTYVGALPGKIIQGMRKAGTINPVFLLDEVDKMSSDQQRGDPASALLEVLDPEQNVAFNDHYLELDFNLSKTLFITTANSMYTIPLPLLDRMEVIELNSYTEEEKLNIAKKYLVPKQIAANGIREDQVKFSSQTLLFVIRRYTKESGVRTLEREIGTLIRKSAREMLESKGKKQQIILTEKLIEKFLEAPRYKYGVIEGYDQIGTTNGLAWTSVGGEMLVVEVTVMSGRGLVEVTGHLGDVMKESAKAAISYVRSRAGQLGLDKDFYSKTDIHIHATEAAIPKDGPSAGVTIATSLVSALTKRPVKKHFAMTGEITIRGHVLPIGGLKEKIMAAYRAGVKDVIIPEENVKDLKEVPEVILKELTIHPVKEADEVLKLALVTEEGEKIFMGEEEEYMFIKGDKGYNPRATVKEKH